MEGFSPEDTRDPYITFSHLGVVQEALQEAMVTNVCDISQNEESQKCYDSWKERSEKFKVGFSKFPLWCH